MSILLSILLAFSLTSGVMLASSNATPGDITYGAKLFKENLELSFANSTEAEAKVYAKQAEARIDEYTKLRLKVETDIFASEQNGTDAEVVIEQIAEEKSSLYDSQKLAQSTTVQALLMLSLAEANLRAQLNFESANSIRLIKDELKNQAEASSLDISAAVEVEADGSTDNTSSSHSSAQVKLQGLIQ